MVEALGIFNGNVIDLEGFVIELLMSTNNFQIKPNPTTIDNREMRLQCIMSLTSDEIP